jgi:hypothetical protein
MKTVATEAAAGLAFAAIGVAVALGVVLVRDVEASPDPDASYVLRGMSPLAGQQCSPYKDDPVWGDYWIDGWHTCWHLTEPGYPAIDYTRTDGQTEGSHVYLDYEGDFQLFKIEEYEDHCTGVRAKIYLGSYAEQNYRGDMHYLHIEPNEYWLGKEVPYQLIWIGDVTQEDDPNCGWTGFHLHQSAEAAGTPFYSNKFRDPSQGYDWQHAILWEAGGADSDGDEFTNDNELYVDTDPFDDCPDSSSDDAWPADINIDTWCNSVDQLMFPANVNMPAQLNVEPTYDARYDLNTDGWVNSVDQLILPAKCDMPEHCTN